MQTTSEDRSADLLAKIHDSSSENAGGETHCARPLGGARIFSSLFAKEAEADNDYHRFETSETNDGPQLEAGEQIEKECSPNYKEEWASIRPFKFKCQKLLLFVGPGFLMSIAYLDPGNIAGDLVAGVNGDYRLIWTLMYATALGLYYQMFAVRIGVVTERNLAKLCAQQFSPFSRYVLWIMTELAIIGCDIQEVLGSATALYLLFGIEIWIGVLITIADSFIFLFIHYFGARKLEFFFAFLVLIMAATFMINMFAAKPDYEQVALGMFVPTVPKGSLGAALGLVGAVIMPHNLYLHSQLVLSRRVESGNRNA
jgi:Mn2+/Fe2+ NRAMP family transporter